MSIGQATNSITEAPQGMLDMKAGPSADAKSAHLSLQEQFLCDAEETMANVFNNHTQFNGSTKPTTTGFQSSDNLMNHALLVQQGSKKYLNVPNPAEDIYNTPAANKAFAQLFDPKKVTTAVA